MKQMKIRRIGGLSSKIVFEYISDDSRFYAEDVEYIKSHYDSVVVHIG